MKVELRGTIRAAFRQSVGTGSSSVELNLPQGGLPLSRLLATLAESAPGAARTLLGSGHGDVLRVVHNGTVVERDEDPLIREGDSLLLLVAVAGGER